MTEKLYYSDSYIFDFQATVTGIESINNKIAVILDKTAFFPEGGGQSADTGYIGNSFIYDVCEKDGIIYHLTNAAELPSIGAELFCRIDDQKRFARMQSHTGEHIVSGIAHKLFGVDNVGFHMDDTLMTVDFNKPLTKEQLKIVEDKANECVYRNVLVNTSVVSAEEAASYNYRSKLEFTDAVRLVEIEGTDLCACCAPHVKRTGEIGIIKILTSISHRGGVRITLICGKTALDDYGEKHNATMNISAQLCAKHNETAEAVGKLIEANTNLKYDFSVRQKNLLEIIASYIEAHSVITEFYDKLSMDEIREICNFAKEKCDKLCIILSGNDDAGYAYCIYSDLPGLLSAVKLFNTCCNGSGGGRGNMLQGKVKASKEQIINFFKELKV